MKKLKKIIDLLLKVVELLPILIEFLRALDRDTNVIKSKLDSLNVQVEDMKQLKQLKESKQVADNAVIDSDKQLADGPVIDSLKK